MLTLLVNLHVKDWRCFLEKWSDDAIILVSFCRRKVLFNSNDATFPVVIIIIARPDHLVPVYFICFTGVTLDFRALLSRGHDRPESIKTSVVAELLTLSALGLYQGFPERIFLLDRKYARLVDDKVVILRINFICSGILLAPLINLYILPCLIVPA